MTKPDKSSPNDMTNNTDPHAAALAKLGQALQIASDALHDLAEAVDQAGETLQAAPRPPARGKAPAANRNQPPL